MRHKHGAARIVRDRYGVLMIQRPAPRRVGGTYQAQLLVNPAKALRSVGATRREALSIIRTLQAEGYTISAEHLAEIFRCEVPR